MPNTPTTPELEQRLKEIAARCEEQSDENWSSLEFRAQAYPELEEWAREVVRDRSFLLSALREALATVEKLGERVDRKDDIS